MNIRRPLAIAVATLCATLALASPPASAQPANGQGASTEGAKAPAAPASAADAAAAATVRAGVEGWLKGRFKVDEVRRTPLPGIWEVRIGSDLLYADEKGQYAFVEGQLVELRTNRSLTQERTEELLTVKWSELPLNLAIKQVIGKGRRQVAVFEDPNCPHCRNTRRELLKLEDVTIYTFAYPILAADSEKKVRQALCAPDKVKAWNELVMEGKAPANAGTCDAPVDKLLELGRKLRVQGTPTLIFANGKRIPGGVPGPQLQKLVDENSKAG